MGEKEAEQEVDISFFVPCLNEEKNIAGTLETIALAVEGSGVRHEVLVVDDCSQDGTVGVVRAHQHTHPEQPVILITSDTHQGLGVNYIRAAKTARGRYYMLVNGDNVERREVITALLSRLGQADIIIPYFGGMDNRPLVRRIISRTFTLLVNLLSGNRIGYYNGAVVHLRENVLRRHPGTKGFAYQAELITLLLARGASYAQVEVPSEERQHGVSKAFRPMNCLSVGHSLIKIGLRRLRGPAD